MEPNDDALCNDTNKAAPDIEECKYCEGMNPAKVSLYHVIYESPYDSSEIQKDLIEATRIIREDPTMDFWYGEVLVLSLRLELILGVSNVNLTELNKIQNQK